MARVTAGEFFRGVTIGGAVSAVLSLASLGAVLSLAPPGAFAVTPRARRVRQDAEIVRQDAEPSAPQPTQPAAPPQADGAENDAATAQPPPEQAAPQGATPQAAADNPQLKDSEQTLGPFRIGGTDYAVVLHYKLLRTGAKTTSTLSALQIRDTAGNVAYESSFPYGVSDGEFAQRTAAGSQLMAGHGGAAIVIRYAQESDSGRAPESWQVFGMVAGKLASLGAPLPLGQGGGIAAGGVLTGVMVKNGISVVPLASTADELEFRVWEGHFWIDVPVNVDWAMGEWSQAQECYELSDGSLRPKGCNLRVAAVPKVIGGDPSYVTLFATTDGDAHNAQPVAVSGNSQVQFVEARAVVNWTSDGDRIGCSFDDVWLHVHINGQDGWVHGDADLAAMGLPAGDAPQ